MTNIETLSDGGERLSDPHLLRIEPAKMTEYLLNREHPVGGAKAKFFRGIGFSEKNVEEFAAALRQQAAQNKIAEVVPHEYGKKTVVDCFMPTPSGKFYCIRSVWNDLEDGLPPKLITAVPLQL